MRLNFGDTFSNALHDIKKLTGKKIAILQDELGYGFDPPISGSTIEKWRYRSTQLSAVQLERLAECLLSYGHPDHDRDWLADFLSHAGIPYPQPICDRLFPPRDTGNAAPGAISAKTVGLQPPDLIAYRPLTTPGFVGRAGELNLHQQALKSNRLVVVAGMAGIGKTSLAAHLAHATENLFVGVFWHSFHELNLSIFLRRLAGFIAHFAQPELWDLFESAREAAINPPDETTCFDILITALEGLPVLICLDDLQFVDDQPALIRFLKQFHDWQARNAGPALLITTRRFPQFLIVDPEWVELSGLSLIDTRVLMAGRAPALSTELVEELHRITGGNGAFLTMAAVVLQRASDPGKMIGRLATTPNIERFLLEEVDGRLTTEQQAVMTAIAVLGGYPAERGVLEAMLDFGQVRRVLRLLLDQYLLLVQEREAGQAYTQHHLLRAFYRDQPTRATRRALHRQAAEYFEYEAGNPFQAVFNYVEAAAASQAVGVASAHVGEMINDGQARPLMTALTSLEANDLSEEERLQLWLTLGRLDLLLGHYDRGRTRLEQAAETLQTMPQSARTDRLKGQICLTMAELLERHSPPDGLRWAQRGLEVIGAESDNLKHKLQIQAGTIMMHMGNFGAALEQMLDSLETIPTHNRPLRLNVLKNLGAIYWHLDQPKLAQEYSRMALELSRQLKDHLQTSRIAINLGPIFYTSGDWAGAISSLEEALIIAQRLGSHSTVLSLHVNLGRCYVDQGDDARAQFHLAKGIELAEESGAHQAVAARINLARLHLIAGRFEEAQTELLQAENEAAAKNDQLSLAAVHTLQAEAWLGLGDLSASHRLADQAREEARLINDLTDVGICWRISGQIAAAEGDDDGIQDAFTKSAEILDPIDRYQAALTRLIWGERLLNNEEIEPAIELVQRAHAVFVQLGALREISRTQDLLARHGPEAHE